jgi:threonine/homoserine/homoserine lactone efflux protein
MLSQAIGGLLPSAIGVALSPIPIIAVILMLGTPRARRNGLAFALGWVAGLVAVCVIVLVVAHGASTPDSSSSQGVRWGTLALGFIFLVMAVRQLRNRPKKGEAAEMPKWLAGIDRFTPAKSLGLGVLLSAANPKNLALSAAAAGAIARVGLSTGDEVVAVAVFVVIASVTVVGPVAFYLFATTRAERPLQSIKEFMTDHNAVIMFVVLLVLGAKLVGSGVSG